MNKFVVSLFLFLGWIDVQAVTIQEIPRIALGMTGETKGTESNDVIIDEVQTIDAKKHGLALGLYRVMFQEDLREFNRDTFAVGAQYLYLVAPRSVTLPRLGLNFNYFQSLKDDYKNTYFVLSPILKLMFPVKNWMMGVELGFDVSYWTLRKTFIQDLPLHEDVLVGIHGSWFIPIYTAVHMSLSYHAQEYSKNASYFMLGWQYQWEIL